MTGIFREIKQRCDLYEAKQLNKDSFTNQISVLKGKSITLKLKDKQLVEIPLNWTKNSIGQFSAKQWITEIIKEVVNLLNSEN